MNPQWTTTDVNRIVILVRFVEAIQGREALVGGRRFAGEADTYHPFDRCLHEVIDIEFGDGTKISFHCREMFKLDIQETAELFKKRFEEARLG